MADRLLLRLPINGTRWVWEIDKDYSRTIVQVKEVRFNGEEWWVKTVTLPDAPIPMYIGDMVPSHPDSPSDSLNELSRFWEACRNAPIGGRLEDLSHPISEEQAKGNRA